MHAELRSSAGVGKIVLEGGKLNLGVDPPPPLPSPFGWGSDYVQGGQAPCPPLAPALLRSFGSHGIICLEATPVAVSTRCQEPNYACMDINEILADECAQLITCTFFSLWCSQMPHVNLEISPLAAEPIGQSERFWCIQSELLNLQKFLSWNRSTRVQTSFAVQLSFRRREWTHASALL